MNIYTLSGLVISCIHTVEQCIHSNHSTLEGPPGYNEVVTLQLIKYISERFNLMMGIFYFLDSHKESYYYTLLQNF